jgi:methyltransferase (TIGR00027 family)
MNFVMPSKTSQAVALTRAELARPASAEGDADAQRRLCAGMAFDPPAWLRPSIEARTRFVDEQVQAAIWAGVCQIVICGAGYDDRALRFRTAGVRFFELDHPGTQQDKARRLRAMSADAAVTLAPTDFRTDEVGEVLADAGHDSGQSSLFVCEGLLIYLEQQTCQRLLAGLAARSALGSRLAVSIATHADGFDSADVVATANARRAAAVAEPWRTILPAGEHLALLACAGWMVRSVTESPAGNPEVSHGRHSLLVSAVPYFAGVIDLGW